MWSQHCISQSLLKDSTGAWRISCSFEETAKKKEKKKKKATVISHRCKWCMRKLLSAAQKDTVQIWDRRTEHMQITDWILSPHCSSIRSGRWEKKTKICSLQKTVKNLLGEEKRRKEEKVFCFSFCHYWSQNGYKWETPKLRISTPQREYKSIECHNFEDRQFQLSCILEATYFNQAQLPNSLPVGLTIYESQSATLCI